LRSRRFYAKRLIGEAIFLPSQKICGVKDAYSRDSRAIAMGKVALVAGDEIVRAGGDGRGKDG